MSINYTHWKDVSADLKQRYAKHYITPEQYIGENENPLENLVVLPEVTDFFGTKVLNIFIVAFPYGWKKEGASWEESWPPEGFDDAKQRHKDSYNKYTKYKTLIYMDYNLVQVIEKEFENSKIREMFDTLKGHMQSLCDELEDYGFELRPDITQDVGADHFKEDIDEFYKDEE